METAAGTPTPTPGPAVYSRLRCRKCVQPVTVTGDPRWGRAVHTAPSTETGPDEHLVAPIDGDLSPSLEAARGASAEGRRPGEAGSYRSGPVPGEYAR